MKKTVPLVVYDQWGVKTVIGSADVEIHENDTTYLSLHVTDERWKRLSSFNPNNYSIDVGPEGPVEVVRIFPPAIKKD